MLGGRLGSKKQKVCDKRRMKIGQSYMRVFSSKIVARMRLDTMLGSVLASGRDDVKFAPFLALFSFTFYHIPFVFYSLKADTTRSALTSCVNPENTLT